MKHLASWLLRRCLLPIVNVLQAQSCLSLNVKSHTGVHKCFFHMSVGIRQTYQIAIKNCFGGRENEPECLLLVFCT